MHHPVTPLRPPAAPAAVVSLPAPAAEQRGDTPNRAAWMSIADFLARQNLRHVLAQLQRASAAQETRA